MCFPRSFFNYVSLQVKMQAVYKLEASCNRSLHWFFRIFLPVIRGISTDFLFWSTFETELWIRDFRYGTYLRAWRYIRIDQITFRRLQSWKIMFCTQKESIFTTRLSTYFALRLSNRNILTTTKTFIIPWVCMLGDVPWYQQNLHYSLTFEFITSHTNPGRQGYT